MPEMAIMGDIEMRRRRAHYRANHRGTKELDHVVGRYADARVPIMTSADLGEFEQFLALPDPVLQEWFFGAPSPIPSEFSLLVEDMRAFHGLDPAGRAKD